MKYTGSCHCGNMKFEAEGAIDSGLSCNCSMCQRRGSLLWFIPRASLRLLTPEANLSTYTFNKHVIKHRFCSSCGIHVFGEGVDPKGNAMGAVNLRTLEGIDLATIPVHNHNGKAM